MKTLFSLCFVIVSLFGCAEMYYPHVPLEQNPDREISSPPISIRSVFVQFINKSGPIYIKSRGPLNGVTLDTWQRFDTEIPTGKLRIRWDYETVEGRVIPGRGNVIITSNTRRVVFYPPYQDDMFKSRGRPSVQAYNY